MSAVDKKFGYRPQPSPELQTEVAAMMTIGPAIETDEVIVHQCSFGKAMVPMVLDKAYMSAHPNDTEYKDLRRVITVYALARMQGEPQKGPQG